MKRGFKVGLALGGGGARGFAHLGVIKALERHSIPIDLVVGTSMGAIIGAAYCLNPDASVIESRILEMIKQPEIKRLESFFAQASEENHQKFVIQKLLGKIKNIYLWNLRAAKRWIIRTEPIVRILQELFKEQRFSNAQIPFACTAVDLNTATCVTIQEGRILEAILASSSIPGIFAPVKRGEQLLADGGVLSSVPARQARILGADFLIGVDLNPKYSKRESLTGLDEMFQADWIKSCYINRLNLRYCDWVIKPEIVNLSWSAFSQGKFCIQQGESVALRDIDEIKRALIRKRRFYFLRRFLKNFIPQSHKGIKKE
jgi:NTE family protein